MPDASRSPPFGLGVDAGGTATRWLLIDAHGRECARGEVAGFSATQLGTVQRPLLDAALAELAAALAPGTALTLVQSDGARAAACLALGLAPPLAALPA